MSQTIDSRVVEMRFDNKQFEAGAKQSMSTLEKLKNALKLPNTGDALKGLDNATKNVKLSGLEAGIDALSKRFSTLGIVGMRIIENITDGLMNKLNRAIGFVTDSIVSGGIKRAMNIENAHFQLQALLKDETKVQAVMADAMESVDGTAYAYDEAAKAASQFAASGLQSGDQMLGALKGITGVAAMTNSSFEDIARVFTTVAGNGRLMGDQLLQLSSRGLNAASTVAKYFEEVQGQAGMTEKEVRSMVSEGKISFKDFADAMTWAFGDSAKRANETFTGALSNMKSALARIGAGFVSPLVEQNGEMVKLFNALRIQINNVKSSLVFDEQRSAIAGLSEVTKISKDNLGEMFSTIKSNGKVSGDELMLLHKRGANATKALTTYINGVNDGSIRASYSIQTAVKDFTKGMKVTSADVRGFVRDGKIDLQTFTSAMEHEFGTEKVLSKQFTDWFQNYIAKITNALNKADITKPMQIFYYWVESVKNVAKGLVSVLSPVGKAFSEVFSGFSIDAIASFSSAVETLTSKMKLSEKGSQGLHDAFKGVFDIVKLLLDGVFSLAKAIFSVNTPVISVSDSFFGFIGLLGQGLSKAAEWIKSCDAIKIAFGFISEGFKLAGGALTGLVGVIVDFLSNTAGLEVAQNILMAIYNGIVGMGTAGAEYLGKFVGAFSEMVQGFLKIDRADIDKVLQKVSEAFSNMGKAIEKLDFTHFGESVLKLKDRVTELFETLSGSKGFTTFVHNAAQYGKDLKEAFNYDAVVSNIDYIMDVFNKFSKWVENTLNPMFKDLTIGNVVAAGGGIGIIYALIKAAKAFEKATGIFESIPKLLGKVGNVLTEYQKNLKSDSILKIAGAIGILAASITLLSFADMKNAWQAAVILGIIGGLLLLAASKFKSVSREGNEALKGLNIFADGVSNSMQTLAKAVKIRAVGKSMKDFGFTILEIGAVIIAMGLMYEKNPEALTKGALFAAGIGGALVAIMALGTIAGQFFGKGMKKFSKLLNSLTGFSAALGVVLVALIKLFKMELPNDWESKLSILTGILVGVAALTLVLGVAGKLSGEKTGMAAPILAMAVMLYSIVGSLKMLFGMEMPGDYAQKILILTGIFGGMIGLIGILGIVGKLSGGEIKAAGTILSMSLLLAAIVASLMFLTLLPGEELKDGAFTLGAVLMAVGVALAGAGQIAGGKDVAKSVYNMALMVGAITASLAILTMIDIHALHQSAIVLGAMLLTLATDFLAVSKISGSGSWVSILSMVAMVLSITISLYKLAEQPWDSMLAAATSLSMVLLSVSGSILLISKSNPNLNAMGIFAEAIVGILAISYALYQLADKPWENMLASAASISMVMVAFSAVLALCSIAGAAAAPALIGIGLLDLFIANFAVVLLALGKLSDNAKALLQSGSAVFVQIGQAIGDFVGAIINGVISGISSTLPKIGSDLSAFMDNLQPFISGSKGLKPEMAKNVGYLAAAVIALTVADVINGFTRIGKLSISSLAKELSDFAVELKPFIANTKNIKQENTKACLYIAEMILALTAGDIVLGIGRFLGITGNLKSFSEELKAMGPNIKDFADQVKGIKSESVEGAVKVGEMMASLATKLPVTDGWVAKVFGSKSLAAFGSELSKFGESIVPFCETVKDIDAGSVTGVQAVTTIMSDLANGLPNLGGFTSFIFGSKSISKFGEELSSFGESIVPFCEQVKDVPAGAVNGVSNVIAIMSSLANDLPTTTSLWNTIFGGGKTSLSQFGSEMVKFGELLKTFESSISGLNLNNIETAVSAIKELVDVSMYAQNNRSNGLQEFSGTLESAAKKGIDSFVSTFSGAGSKAKVAVTNFFGEIGKAMDGKGSVIVKKGAEFGKGFCDSFSGGLSANGGKITGTISQITNGLMTQFSTLTQKMSSNGKNIIEGINIGLQKGVPKLQTQASALATAIDRSFCKTSEIESPSKVAINRGEMVATGYAIGIDNKKSEPVEEAANLADEVAEAMDMSKSFKKNKTHESTKQAFDETNLIIEEATKTAEELLLEDIQNQLEWLKGDKEIKEGMIQTEEEYWEKLLEVKKAGADADKYKDIEMVDFQKEILEKTSDVLKEYTETFESARDSIMGTLDLFEEVELEEAKAKEDIVKNLQDQINAYDDYTAALTSLNERLGESNLGEYLRTLGVDSLEQLKEINSMTDEELSAYAALYDAKMSAATEAAAAQLYGLKEETEQKLNDVFGTMDASVNLYDFVGVFDGTLSSIAQYVMELNNSYIAAQEDARLAGAEIPTGMGEGFEQSVVNFTDKVNAALDEAIKEVQMQQVDETKTIGLAIGGSLGEGISEGITENTDSVTTSSEELIKMINDALKSSGEIHSPSALTNREVGKPLAEGIGEGLKEGAETLSTAASDIIKALNESLVEESKTIPDSFKELGGQISDALRDSLPDSTFNDIGQNIVQGLITGVESKQSNLISTVATTCKDLINKFKSDLPDNTFKTYGQNIIQGIINGINAKKPILMSTVKATCTSIINDFRSGLPQNTFVTFGQNIVQWIINGVNNEKSKLMNTIRDVCEELIKMFRDNLQSTVFEDFGKDLMSSIAEGIESNKDVAENAALTVCEDLIDVFKNNFKESDLVEIGENAAIGLAKGIENRIEDITDSAIRAAAAAIEAAKEELEEESPSKVTTEMGEFFSIGMANGIVNQIRAIKMAGTEASDEAIKPVKDTVYSIKSIMDSGYFDVDPVIRPTLDLTDIRDGAKQISAMMNQTYDLSAAYNRAMDTAQSFRRTRSVSADDENGSKSKFSGGATFEFKQYNYSPKALSRADIYRQTNNQFAAFERAVKSV